MERYPAQYHCEHNGMKYADMETPRVLATPTPGIGPLLREAWERYGLPVAVTEAHIDANREDQLRWLLEIWNAAEKERLDGADIRAVTVWALLGSFDWNCLVTECRGYYEPGPFDVRSPAPRPTALAEMMRELASGRPLSNPVLQGQGWWRRPERFLVKPVAAPSAIADLTAMLQFGRDKLVQPILITGASGTLGSAFARYKPWALINAAGYVRVDQAEIDHERCWRENTLAPAILALAGQPVRRRAMGDNRRLNRRLSTYCT